MDSILQGVYSDTLAPSPDQAPCTDLTGIWRNQLGSTMVLQRIADTCKITGRYYTTVESKTGASEVSSDISGLVQPVEGGSLVAFNILWKHGASMTAWVGQCNVHDGQEKIFTTWILRSEEDPEDRWMSTKINQDTFWRVDEVSPDATQDDVVNDPPLDIVAKWKSFTDDSVDIQSTDQGLFEGLHKGTGEPNVAPIFGRFDGNHTYTALGFVAANDQYIRGWTGQIYNPEDSNPLMETSWLSHKFSNLCNDPRKYVEFGMDTYIKESADAE